jgi:hypothetical protein
MNLFETIGKHIDNVLNYTVTTVSITTDREPEKEKYTKRIRITDKELYDIIVSDFKPTKARQLEALHELGFGVSNTRMATMWNRVKIEALNEQIKENMTRI